MGAALSCCSQKKVTQNCVHFLDYSPMAAFGGIAPTYHIELLEKPTIVWDFHSLLLAIQMMFRFMLTDEKSSLKVCKHCGKVFLASRPNTVFCSGQCKNQYNVYKSRGKGRTRNDNDNKNQ